MKEKKLFDSITNVDDAYIEEAANTKLTSKKPVTIKIFALVASFALILVVAGQILLKTNHPAKPNKTVVDEIVEVIFPKAYAFEDYEGRRSVLEDNPVEEEFLLAVKDFSYRTSSELLSESESNINYSPISLYYPLALAATGAKEDTQAELCTLLGVKDTDYLSQQCRNLYRILYTDNEIGKLKIANSLWLNFSNTWKQEFTKNAAKNFYTVSFPVDFTDKATGKEMGKWINNQTNGVLTPDIETSTNQILSIINTIYFKDEWINRFDESATKEGDFTLSDGNSITCDFMNQTGMQSFARGKGYTRAQLNMKNTHMVFILPDEGVSPQSLVATPDKMKETFEGGEDYYGNVIWKMPKFSYDSNLKLKDTLRTLGVRLSFLEGANFKGMSEEQAFISQVSQQTHIAVNEEGVEAAAFTQIDYCGSAMPEEEAEMILDRPFLYGIYSSEGTLLFVGICENPIASK